MSCSLKRLLWKLKSSLRLRWQTDFRHMGYVRPKVVVRKSFDLLLDVASAYLLSWRGFDALNASQMPGEAVRGSSSPRVTGRSLSSFAGLALGADFAKAINGARHLMSGLAWDTDEASGRGPLDH